MRRTRLTEDIEKDNSDAQSWYLLGRCYMSQQKYPKAYEAYQQAVYRDGRNPTFWCSIGVLYYQINQYRDALDAYSRAIRLNPYISEVWYDLGTLVSTCTRTRARARSRFSLRQSSMSPATIKPMMLSMPTNAPPNWTPKTNTSSRDWRYCAMANLRACSTSPPRLRPKTSIRRHTKQTESAVLRARSGALRRLSLLPRPSEHIRLQRYRKSLPSSPVRAPTGPTNPYPRSPIGT